jgi:hypothetical protein
MDAKVQLADAKGRVRELAAAVRVCEERVGEGASWPTDENAREIAR